MIVSSERTVFGQQILGARVHMTGAPAFWGDDRGQKATYRTRTPALLNLTGTTIPFGGLVDVETGPEGLKST
jgi:hypothetical protein